MNEPGATNFELTNLRPSVKKETNINENRKLLPNDEQVKLLEYEKAYVVENQKFTTNPFYNPSKYVDVYMKLLSFLSAMRQNSSAQELTTARKTLENVCLEVKEFFFEIEVAMRKNSSTPTTSSKQKLEEVLEKLRDDLNKPEITTTELVEYIKEQVVEFIELRRQSLNKLKELIDYHATLCTKYPGNLTYTRVQEASPYSDTSICAYNPLYYDDVLEMFTKLPPISSVAPSGGSKSRRRHRRKPVRKTRRGRGRKSKAKPKTHRRRHAHHSRIRKHKKYTRKH